MQFASAREPSPRARPPPTSSLSGLRTSSEPGSEARSEPGSEARSEPGFEFKAVKAMLTNFHLPQSTLLMLVSAFAGRENILRAYEHAVSQRYRFYSYGDCMFIE